MTERFTSSYKGMSTQQKIGSIIRFLNGEKDNYPTPDEVRAIESQPFDPSRIQAYLDHLDGGTPTDVRVAAMLRGSFNQLLEACGSTAPES